MIFVLIFFFDGICVFCFIVRNEHEGQLAKKTF